MSITSVTYSRKYPTGPFLNETIGVEITLEENQDPLEALAEAKKLTDAFHVEANPHLYNGVDAVGSKPFLEAVTLIDERELLPVHDINQEREAVSIENATTLEELATVKPKDKKLMTAYVKRLQELSKPIINV